MVIAAVKLDILSCESMRADVFLKSKSSEHSKNCFYFYSASFFLVLTVF